MGPVPYRISLSVRPRRGGLATFPCQAIDVDLVRFSFSLFSSSQHPVRARPIHRTRHLLAASLSIHLTRHDARPAEGRGEGLTMFRNGAWTQLNS